MQEPPFNHTGYYQNLAERRLMAAKCLSCESLYLPPRAMCPCCYGTDMEWEELSGEGELIGFTTIYVGLSEMVKVGYNRDRPYCSGVIRLAEGPVVTGQIVDGDCDHPEGLRVGMPVRAVFFERGSGETRQMMLGFEHLFGENPRRGE